MLHTQKSYKVTFKKVLSVPGAQGAQLGGEGHQARGTGLLPWLLTLDAPGNFLFVSGARGATGYKPQARQRLAPSNLEQDRGQHPLNQGAHCRVMRYAGWGAVRAAAPEGSGSPDTLVSAP